MAVSKRVSEYQAKVNQAKDQVYDLAEAVTLIKQCATAKFDERIELSVRLGVDPRKADQMVRSAIVLPHGSGKSLKVAVVAAGEQAEAAKEAGADAVGYEDMVAQLEKNPDFDMVIATPDAMKLLGKIGPILGPRGLMPNPKVGTVTSNVAAAVRDAKAGQVQFRTEKTGIIHCPVGRASFEAQQLVDNIAAMIAKLKALKPTAAKGLYMKAIHLSSTMGPGLRVSVASVPQEVKV